MGSEVLSAKTSFRVIERLSLMDSAKPKPQQEYARLVLLDTTEYALVHMPKATIPGDSLDRSKMIDVWKALVGIPSLSKTISIATRFQYYYY